MRYVIQRLLRGGLMGVNLLQTFVSHHVQPLRQREMTIWMYPGSSYPDRPFFVELGDTEINTQIRGVLAHRADQNFGSGPVPLWEGGESSWVSSLELTFIYLCQFLLLNACTFFRRISSMHTAPCRGSPYLRM
jgi:hypothetical protein